MEKLSTLSRIGTLAVLLGAGAAKTLGCAGCERPVYTYTLGAEITKSCETDAECLEGDPGPSLRDTVCRGGFCRCVEETEAFCCVGPECMCRNKNEFPKVPEVEQEEGGAGGEEERADRACVHELPRTVKLNWASTT